MPQTTVSFDGFGNAAADTFNKAGRVLAAPVSTKSSLLQTPRYSLILIALILLIAVRIITVSKSKKLPPGVRRLPRLPGLPYAGRFWDVPGPGVAAALHFGGLHKKYGPIYEWKVMGVLHIWVETDKVARDLFVLRQKNYCDRNALPGAVGVKEDCEILPLSGYSDDFKRHKNFIHSIMRHSHPKQFYGWPVIENKKTLRRLLETPDRWSEHMLVHCARTISSIAWGNPEHGKKLLTVVPELLKAVSPEGPIVNKLTFLQNLPAAVSPWKKREAIRKQTMTEAFYEALDDVKAKVAAGDAPNCWSTLWLENEKGIRASKLDYHEAAYALGSSSFVAIATIGGPLHAFFLAMCHYPEEYKKLQKEIDEVCGDHLPTVEEIPRLPRLRAVVKELLRWRQSTPLGVPHVCLSDDEYSGFLIPKGAMLHANHYLISREADKYPQGDQFIPDRWLDASWPSFKEPLTEFPNLSGDRAFGYGSRSCPGVDLTQMELVTLFGALAWSFDVKPKEGTILPWYEVNPYVITMCKPFPLDITARSEAKRQWIMDEVKDPGYWLTTEPKTRWDIVHDTAKEPWTWQGLAPMFEQPKEPIVYPPGH